MTVVHAKLPCGFIVTETSACIDPEHDRDLGAKICMGRVRDKVWELKAITRCARRKSGRSDHGLDRPQRGCRAS
ncbi:MAG: Gp49 family protein [Eggerthellaceae bacterium]